MHVCHTFLNKERFNLQRKIKFLKFYQVFRHCRIVFLLKHKVTEKRNDKSDTRKVISDNSQHFLIYKPHQEA